MSNRLFQEAIRFVENAERIAAGNESGDLQAALETAENALRSAYANTTTAEKAQLSAYQQRLEQIKQ